jgi:hypothetical protein
MTVKELFDSFTMIFNEILYFDDDNNLQDKENLVDSNGEFKTKKYKDFLSKYGNYKVNAWKFDNRYNIISISIEEW